MDLVGYVDLSFIEEADAESELIAWKGSGHFSHVDARRPDGMRWGARSDKVGGAGPGIQLRTPNYLPWIRETIFRIPAMPLQETSWYAWWESQQGKPYDKLEIVGYALNLELMHVGWYVCSAAVMTNMTSCDMIEPQLYLTPNKIDPVMTSVITSTIHGVKWWDHILNERVVDAT